MREPLRINVSKAKIMNIFQYMPIPFSLVILDAIPLCLSGCKYPSLAPETLFVDIVGCKPPYSAPRPS